jgi:hypothetical protein
VRFCVEEGFSNKSYWTSGYDRFNPGKYNWCSANNSEVEGINWKNGVVGKTAGCLKVFYHIMPKAPRKNCFKIYTTF